MPATPTRRERIAEAREQIIAARSMLTQIGYRSRMRDLEAANTADPGQADALIAAAVAGLASAPTSAPAVTRESLAHHLRHGAIPAEPEPEPEQAEAGTVLYESAAIGEMIATLRLAADRVAWPHLDADTARGEFAAHVRLEAALKHAADALFDVLNTAGTTLHCTEAKAALDRHLGRSV